jgi:hypothetical protein
MQTIICPINVVGAMGKGLALAFKNRVPGLYEFYRSHYGVSRFGWQQRIHQLEVFTVNPNKKVLLFPTKGDWKDPAILSAIEHNLQLVADHYQEMGIESLGIPMLGCGIKTGQLSWQRDVEPLVDLILEPIPLPVKVLTG